MSTKTKKTANLFEIHGHIFVLLLLMQCLFTIVLKADDSLKSIAILSQPEIQESGLGDILTVELQDIAGVSLVEREQLDKIFKEISLTNLLGAQNINDRRHAGSLLKADWLVILALAKKNEQKLLRVVVCDSESGTRLINKQFPFNHEDFEANCTEIKTIMMDALRNYPNGVDHVIGVSRFISKTLVHDYDQLQSGYANILETAFMSVPGLAVIEIDEAQAVMREHEIAGSNRIERVVPIFIEGEYTVNDAVSKNNSTVDITVSVSNAKGVIKSFVKNKLEFDQVIKLLSGDVANAVAGYLSIDQSDMISTEQQFQAFVKKAEEFERIGMRKYSVENREAAILLKPDSVAQRTKLIDQSPIADLRISHLEYLIRNRLVSRGNAVNLFIMVFKSIKPAQRISFINDIYPFVKTLPLTNDQEQVVRKQLVDFFSVEFSKNVIWNGRLGSFDLLSLVVCIHENILPEDVGVSQEILFYISSVVYPEINDVILASVGGLDGRTLKLLEKMSQSQNKSIEMYGKFGLLIHQYSRLKNNDLDLTSLVPQVDVIYEKLTDSNNGIWQSKDDDSGARRYLYYLDLIRNDINKYSNSNNSLGGKNVNEERYLSYVAAEAITRGRVHFDNISFKVKTKKGNTLKLSRWNHYLKEIRKCTESLDVLWSETAVVVMRQPGILEELWIRSPKKERIDDVYWDGRNFWVGLRGGEILLLDVSGEIVARVGEKNGLPPTDKGVAIHALEENKAIVIGSFSSQERGWCAFIEVKDGKADVNVFHEAIVIKAKDENENVAFSPEWTHEFDSGNENERVILVGRSTSRRPLAIDVNTLKVTLFSCELSRRRSPGENEILSLKGNLYMASSDKVYKYSAGKKKYETIDCEDAGYAAYPLLEYNGHIYYPGPRWWRFDSKMQQKESLISRPFRRKYTTLKFYGVSAHYGIIGWDIEKSFYNMKVSDTDIILNPVNCDYAASLKKYW